MRQPANIEQVLKAASLNQIKSVEGIQYLEDMVVFLINDLCQFFNLSRQMTAIQIGQTAGLIIELYPHFKAEDIVRCFKNIKILKYGKLYEGLDGSKILEFINLYDLERQDEIINYRISESKKYKINELGEYPKQYTEMLRTVTESIKPLSSQIPSINENTKKMKGIFLQYENDFFELIRKGEDKRFVNYKNKMRTLDEYCNLRYEEDHYSETNNPNK